MAKRTYPIMLELAEGGYGVIFPDLPGCVSFGETLDGAIANAEEALSLHLEGMVEDGETLPEASGLASLMLDHPDRAASTVWAVVTVEAPDASERVNIYMAKSLLERIDRFVGSEGGRNRSAFFAIAARRYLEAEGEQSRAARNFSYTTKAADALVRSDFSSAVEAVRQVTAEGGLNSSTLVLIPSVLAEHEDWARWTLLQHKFDGTGATVFSTQEEAVDHAKGLLKVPRKHSIHHIRAKRGAGVPKSES